MNNIALTHFSLVLLASLLTGCAYSVSAPPDDAVWPTHLPKSPVQNEKDTSPVVLWQTQHTEPKPLATVFLRIDLHHPRVEMVVMPANDPDGDGPAEAALTSPRELARRFEVAAAVNCNGFAALPGPDGQKNAPWQQGLPVGIIGLAATDGEVRSEANQKQNNLCFWTDEQGTPHIGEFPSEMPDVDEGCNAWWIDLVKDGNVLPRPGGKRHPRTALGLDESGRWLLLAVVDGRQPGYSVGMTAHELAMLMLENGCHRAINLDGGGSSIMLATGKSGDVQIVNSPSGGKPRPLPVMLGVRRKAE